VQVVAVLEAIRHGLQVVVKVVPGELLGTTDRARGVAVGRRVSRV